MDLPSTNEIRELEEKYRDELTEEEQELEEELETLRKGTSLTRTQIERVIEWKMSTQGGRAERSKEALQDVPDEDIKRVTRTAIAVSNLRTQIDVLRSLPGVGVGTATSILGFVLPETHVVVDYNVYNGVFGKDRESVSPPQAVELTERLRQEYGDTPHSLREVDRVLFYSFRGFGD